MCMGMGIGVVSRQRWCGSRVEAVWERKGERRAEEREKDWGRTDHAWRREVGIYSALGVMSGKDIPLTQDKEPNQRGGTDGWMRRMCRRPIWWDWRLRTKGDDDWEGREEKVQMMGRVKETSFTAHRGDGEERGWIMEEEEEENAGSSRYVCEGLDGDEREGGGDGQENLYVPPLGHLFMWVVEVECTAPVSGKVLGTGVMEDEGRAGRDDPHHA
ncbi:hypothetical protein BJ684DRAFT_17513 [Piptocephalis cylindrospora]|uniref:Uncharacterized protein n=1 Tax=Piptocephalis cylindrospora TaxID=1907219 RepID=A0A4P9Y0F8_9FUNG|nr:hypothetical protein BJ684DRAFT_17513 [Piptocephalis cylindrospora]|eukprot:RKP11952.1 hypothetical protein BJ684DRAFT_17513 [Piptocephalis cylindrospora]